MKEKAYSKPISNQHELRYEYDRKVSLPKIGNNSGNLAFSSRGNLGIIAENDKLSLVRNARRGLARYERARGYSIHEKVSFLPFNLSLLSKQKTKKS